MGRNLTVAIELRPSLQEITQHIHSHLCVEILSSVARLTMSLLVLPPDNDIDTLRRKKPRGKKFRDKISCLWAIPNQ